jgi:hypothetical protein
MSFVQAAAPPFCFDPSTQNKNKKKNQFLRGTAGVATSFVVGLVGAQQQPPPHHVNHYADPIHRKKRRPRSDADDDATVRSAAIQNTRPEEHRGH